jgi:hypothetical protein
MVFDFPILQGQQAKDYRAQQLATSNMIKLIIIIIITFIFHYGDRLN